MNVPSRPATVPAVSAALTPRRQLQQILVHLSGRVGLLGQPDEVRAQLVMMAGAMIQACDDSRAVPDAMVEHLLARAVDTEDVRQGITPLLAAFLTEDQRVFEEFIDLVTTALMLERSSFGGGAERIRHDADPEQIGAVAQLRPMLERADQLARSRGLPEPAAKGPPRRARATGREDPVTTSFWDALDASEREAFRSVASMRTFAAGARLMEEGERADHVMVILGGRAKVCVEENGGERVLAVRGVGQLVGERGALQVSVRSATVIAMELLWALVVHTKDFAAFISAHPRVLGIVQSHLYRRHTGDPAQHEHGGTDTDDAYTAGYSRQHLQPLNGENCTVFLTDVVPFDARTRTDRDRLIIREALFSMTHAALQGIPDVRSADRGDGLLAVVPPNVPTARAMDQMLRTLPAELARHNGTHAEPARFRLRVAVNVGPVVSDTMGISGEGIIAAARLVEAPRFKEAIARSAASLGVIASTFVYETVIRYGRDPGELADYSEVRVKVKESRIRAWIRLLTHDVRRADPPASGADTSGLPAAGMLTAKPRAAVAEQRGTAGCSPGMIDEGFAEFLAGQRQGVLVTLRKDGRPQLSNVTYAWYPEEQTIKVSTTDDRAKTSNMRRDPRVSFHVTSGDFWSYVVVDGHAELSAVAADPRDAAVEELIDVYRTARGEHPDWDDYRAAMVRDRRLAVRLRAGRAYGLIRRG